jgi:hypothetical protein
LRLKEEEEERLGLATVEHSTVGGHRVRLPVAPSAAATLHAKAESLRQTPRAAPAIVAAETAVDVEAGVSGVVVAAETGAPSVATTPRASVSFAAADPTSESAIGKLSLPLEALGHTTFAVSWALQVGACILRSLCAGSLTCMHDSPILCCSPSLRASRHVTTRPLTSTSTTWRSWQTTPCFPRLQSTR